jgi:hypothetical protein
MEFDIFEPPRQHVFPLYYIPDFEEKARAEAEASTRVKWMSRPTAY